jgi:hypothetical protein
LEVEIMETSDGSLDYAPDLGGPVKLQGAKMPLSASGRMELGSFGMLEELLIEDTEPPMLRKKLYEKTGFFGMEAYSEMPIETTAIALASQLFRKYDVLIVDSFQLMEGTEKNKLKQNMERTKEKLQMLAETFRLSFSFSLCSEFFETRRYRELRRETEAAVLQSEELTELARKTVPHGKNKNDLSFAIDEAATIRYMHIFKGADVKLGQQREKLYDALVRRLEGSIVFAYLPPFFALGEEPAREVTPYAPKSGISHGGKRILFDEIDGRAQETLERVAEKLESGPPKAQAGLYRLALAADHSIFPGEGPGYLFDEHKRGYVHDRNTLITALVKHVIMPYEMNRTTREMTSFLRNV